MLGRTNEWFCVYDRGQGMYLKWRHGDRMSYTKEKSEAMRFRTKSGALAVAIRLGDLHRVENDAGMVFE